jgi:ComF family protein
MDPGRWIGVARAHARDLGADLFDALLDRTCPGCGGAIPRGREVCDACDAAVPRSGSALCLRCLRGDPPVAAGPERACGAHGAGRLLLAGPLFEPPLDRIVRSYKYDGVSRLAAWVASLVPEPPELRGPLGPTYALVPVPLHPSRLAHRGFDQTLLLAHTLSRRWGVPVVSALRRVEDTAPQARLTGEARRRNLAAAFRLAEPVVVRGRALLLLDDVATTGSTLLAAAEALEPADPAWILALSATHGGDRAPGAP